ncbi:cell surface glycoprotein CD200 receptor 1-A [Xenopus laevis]|uniref:Cell surface glycoprotein CD200 receptor 1-A n=1 Tax=Xenopus laevis TaxID=8355 RepID=A0A8J1M6T1_XENLA|nr:cell surface glycoprotein CD200 receptor 1-A [Xenopus laevis]
MEDPPESASVTKSVWVWAGNTTVLRCHHDPGNSLMLVTWKVHPLYNSHCLLSLHIEKQTNSSNCSERMRQELTSLRIENTAVTDQGNYSCEIVNAAGLFYSFFKLKVLVQPSVTLELNKLGVPECRAHGGNPAANMWWTPEAVGSISTNTAMQPDRSWTVTSTYTVTSNNVTQVTCLVSHPTFVQPHVSSIRISSSTAGLGHAVLVRLTVSIIVIIVGSLLIWRLFKAYCAPYSATRWSTRRTLGIPANELIPAL